MNHQIFLEKAGGVLMSEPPCVESQVLQHQPTTPLSYQMLQVCCGNIALTVLRCDLLPDLGLRFRHLVAGEVETFCHTAAILKPQPQEIWPQQSQNWPAQITCDSLRLKPH